MLSTNYSYLGAMSRLVKPKGQCSILLITEKNFKDTYLGCTRARVTCAKLAHICITDRAAYGASTGVWQIGDDVRFELAPSRIRVMEVQFQDNVSYLPGREPNTVLGQGADDRWRQGRQRPDHRRPPKEVANKSRIDGHRHPLNRGCGVWL
jgi:hypothetical protein